MCFLWHISNHKRLTFAVNEKILAWAYNRGCLGSSCLEFLLLHPCFLYTVSIVFTCHRSFSSLLKKSSYCRKCLLCVFGEMKILDITHRKWVVPVWPWPDSVNSLNPTMVFPLGCNLSDSLNLETWIREEKWLKNKTQVTHNMSFSQLTLNMLLNYPLFVLWVCMVEPAFALVKVTTVISWELQTKRRLGRFGALGEWLWMKLSLFLVDDFQTLVNGWNICLVYFQTFKIYLSTLAALCLYNSP